MQSSILCSVWCCVLGNNGHLGLPRIITCVGVESVCVEWEKRIADSSAGRLVSEGPLLLSRSQLAHMGVAAYYRVLVSDRSQKMKQDCASDLVRNTTVQGWEDLCHFGCVGSHKIGPCSCGGLVHLKNTDILR